ncbi:Myosin-M heavy protein [Quillaja saponaria]|uniref:Myosin-M heavy protein n=1 Tax=Quillaja saponaria TaxID=32244 RepID=A0AAD7PC57_QUISA|nr:Myosin-M heavy protein [Quillaja saponaria]
MGKQSKARKPDYLDKGKVTPTQVAFIVDQYLCDNNYFQSRTVFRNEASSLIPNSPIQAPNNLLSLGDMLNEYISLKEQKVMVDQERIRVEEEKCRIQMMLQGMQNVMNAYNASGIPYTPNISAPAKVHSVAVVPQLNNNGGSPSGCAMNNTLTVHPMPPNVNRVPEKFSSTITNQSTNKRKEARAVTDAPSATKRSRGRSSTRSIPSKGQKTLSLSDNAVNTQEVAVPPSTIQSLPYNCVKSGSMIQGSNVTKCLVNQQPLSIPNDSSGPKTPSRGNSCDNDKNISSPEISSSANCSSKYTPQEVTPARYAVISSKRVMVSPMKQMALIESSRCNSSSSPAKKDFERASKRDHVRGRLDFDGADMPMSLKDQVDEISTSSSGKELDFFDIDFPNIDAMEMDFSFTELLSDFDLHCEETGLTCQPTSNASRDPTSGSSHECGVGIFGTNQVISELSSTVTEILSEKNIQGLDSLTAMKSVTKSICILSPVKNCQSFQDQENRTRG